MLRNKIKFTIAVTIMVLFFTMENEVNAAPEPCHHLISYMFKKPEKPIIPKEDKEKMEQDKKKDFLKKWEKIFEKVLGMK